MFRVFFRFLGNCLFFGAPLLILFAAVLVFSTYQVFGPFDPQKIDRMTLIRIMQLRDFRQLPAEKISALTDRAEAEFGRDGAMRPIFEFSPTEKKIYAHFRGKDTATKSYFETNLYLMARIRYFQWMNDYQRFSESERVALMKKVTADMKYWETLYMDFLRAADLPIPTMAELIREFEKMIEEDFKIDATPEEIVRIDTFKRQMNTVIFANEVQGAVKNLSGNVSSAVSNALGTLVLPRKKEKQTNDKNND